MILNNSVIKSLKAGLLVLKSGLHHYSCVLYIVFTLTKQIICWAKADLTILSLWSCKMNKKENGEKQKKFLVFSSSNSSRGPQSFPRWVQTWKCCFEQRECSWSFNAYHPAIYLEDTQKNIELNLNMFTRTTSLRMMGNVTEYLATGLSCQGLQSAFEVQTLSL